MNLPARLTVPSRQDIIDAVDAGIKAAGNKLSKERVKNLRSYAQTTKSFTCGAWEYGLEPKVPCPFAAVGGKKEDPGATEFAKAFDTHLTQIMGVSPDNLPITLRDSPMANPKILDVRQSHSTMDVGFGGEGSR